jgi:hypothetical protein
MAGTGPLGRLAVVTRIEGRRLKIAELSAVPGAVAFAEWGGERELAIAVVLRIIVTSPFAHRVRILADCGLHSLARRMERGRPNDDGAVLRDLKSLADAYRAAVAKGGDFAIPTKSGGKWLGAVTAVKGEPVLAVRTFVE